MPTFLKPLLVLCFLVSSLSLLPASHGQVGFKCAATSAKCKSVVGYTNPNATTLAAVKTLFAVRNLRAILGLNDLPLSTPPSAPVPANSTLKIPVNCVCNAAGVGVSNRQPVYTVQRGDGLDHIATDVFGRLVKYQDIQMANNISNADLIKVGQRLWIPLPCSCEDVSGEQVVHYAHLVRERSTVEGIAEQFGVQSEVLMSVNGIANASQLIAGQVIDVPLKACASMVGNNSLDYPLRVSNGTYVFTANNCVKCRCDAANNWTLQCEPSHLKPSNWAVCPSMQCASASNFYLGNTTSLSSCDTQTCAYAGYTNQSILTNLAMGSSCSLSENKASGIGIHGATWIFLIVTVYSVMLYLQLSQ